MKDLNKIEHESFWLKNLKDFSDKTIREEIPYGISNGFLTVRGKKIKKLESNMVGKHIAFSTTKGYEKFLIAEESLKEIVNKGGKVYYPERGIDIFYKKDLLKLLDVITSNKEESHGVFIDSMVLEYFMVYRGTHHNSDWEVGFELLPMVKKMETRFPENKELYIRFLKTHLNMGVIKKEEIDFLKGKDYKISYE